MDCLWPTPNSVGKCSDLSEYDNLIIEYLLEHPMEGRSLDDMDDDGGTDGKLDSDVTTLACDLSRLLRTESGDCEADSPDQYPDFSDFNDLNDFNDFSDFNALFTTNNNSESIPFRSTLNLSHNIRVPLLRHTPQTPPAHSAQPQPP